MVAEVSMRHFPDYSDASLDPDFSEASFQIPTAGGGPHDLLLNDDSMDFLHNDTLGTPMLPSRTQAPHPAPLTLQDLTPRSTRTRATPARSSLRPRARPGVATPLRRVVAQRVSDALSEDIDISPAPAGLAPAPLTLGQLSPPPLATPLSEPASSSESRRTPGPAPQEAPQARAGNISGCMDGGQGAEPPAIPAPSEPDTEEQRPRPHAGPRHAASQSPGQSVDSMAPTAKQGTRRTSDRLKRRKPTVLHGGITKAKARAAKPGSSVSRSLSAKAASAATSGAPAIARVRSRAEPSNTQRRQQTAVGPTKPHDAQKSKVLSHDGGSGRVGGLAGTLMSYGLRIADSIASSTSLRATEDTLQASLTAAPVVTASRSEAQKAGTGDAEADAAAGAGADGQEERARSRPGSRSASPDAYRDADRRTDLPLTLSQLSPPKPTPPPAPAPARPRQATGGAAPARAPSPARPPTKRPPSAASASGPSQSLKRSKTGHGPEETRAAASSCSSQTSRDGRARPGAQGACQSLASRPAHAHVRQPSADLGAKAKRTGSTRARAASGPSTSRSSAHADADGKRAARGQLTDTRAGAGSGLADGAPAALKEGGHAQGAKPGLERPASALALAPAKPSTKPIGFHFHSDARIEARRAEGAAAGGSLGMGSSRSHAIPDFRALHAAEEAARAARRERVVRVVPQEVQFPTEVRARERERFDAARRAREREVEAQMEARRRAREVEEERELRELRRRAVPRAHEVPEWYADAPRRAKS